MKRGSSGLNLLLGIDKPAGMSSHDVVNVVRRSIGERRVGHAGTLDPLATGVMVVGVGQGTRLMSLLTAETKSYVATITFGSETTTDDAEGEVTRTATTTAQHEDMAYAQSVLESFVGKQEQVPPAYSAIAVNGKRSYARARAGEEVKLEARPVEVMSAQALSVTKDEAVRWQCAFTVSKGTYIRAIARDIGRRTGSAAFLEQLCRTASGSVTLRQCVSLERLEQEGRASLADGMLDPVKALGVECRELSAREARDVASGRPIDAGDIRAGKMVALVRERRLWGVWEERNGQLICKANYPLGIEGIRP